MDLSSTPDPSTLVIGVAETGTAHSSFGSTSEDIFQNEEGFVIGINRGLDAFRYSMIAAASPRVEVQRWLALVGVSCSTKRCWEKLRALPRQEAETAI